MRSNVIIHVSKSLFQFLWTLIQRIVCCNRKKPNKGHPGWKNDEEEPMLTSVAIDSPRHGETLESWNMWGDEYREPTVADRIEAYRYSLKAKTSSNNIEEAKEEDVDFFTDMTPNVSRQTKIYVGPSNAGAAPASRLEVQDSSYEQPEVDTLGTWDDASGWDAEDEGMTQFIREQRKQQKRLNSN